jgi:hypothetical protein
MTKSEIAIANILLAVARRQTTLAQLKRKLDDALNVVEQVGASKCAPSLLVEIDVLTEAIARIERERIKYDKQRNN